MRDRLFGKGEVEDGAAGGGGFNPDAAAVAFDDALADGQADAGAGVFCAVEALEDCEDVAGVLGIDAEAIVGNGKNPVPAGFAGREVDARGIIAVIFDRVRDEILQQLAEVGLINHDLGQMIEGHLRAATVNSHLEAK